jgi:nitrite reductase (NADH) large subunit
MSRVALRERALAEKLRSVSEVLAAAGDGIGCHRCRPALSYYLDVWWCGEHREEAPSRHVNDRVHANIQRDGSFSVVPRMRGGITSPAELRRIADVAERYGVGMVKLTGGQRIDLLGVKKADLPAIWSELGMPSGHAYTKAIRTVKSCVGTDWCRFGVGDSTSLAVAMEQMLEGLYCPHKVKLGVTGCPRNCAEVTVKDLGVMAITGGWEIYVAGAAGMSVRKGDLLCTVETTERALEETAIAIQYYREEANYLERLYHFVPRIGIQPFRAETVEATPERRRALLERFQQSKANATDPWSSVPEREPWRFAEPIAALVSA